MDNNSLIDKISYHFIDLRPEYEKYIVPGFFTTPEIEIAFKIRKKFREKYRTPPTLNQMKIIVQGKQNIGLDADMLNAIYDINIDEYDLEWVKSTVESRIKYVYLNKSVSDMISYLKTIEITNENIDDVQEKTLSYISKGTSLVFDSNFNGSSLFDPKSHIVTHQKKLQSGYNYIDNVLGGGYSTQNLIAFAGIPKVGKCVHGSSIIAIKYKNNISAISFYDLLFKIMIEYVNNNKNIEFLKCDNGIYMDIYNDEIYIYTDNGFKQIKKLIITYPETTYKIETTENPLYCADNHILYKIEKSTTDDSLFNSFEPKETYAKDLNIGDYICGIDGSLKIINIEQLNEKNILFDVEIDSDEHRYFANNILSHNSLFLCNMAVEGIKLSYNIAYITLELSENRVIRRITSNLLNLKVKEYDALCQDEKEIKKSLENFYNQSIKTPGNLIVKEFPTSCATAFDIENWLKEIELYEKIKFDIIIIDYIGIMKDAKSSNSYDMYNKLKNISEDIRGMAMRNNWCIITASQLNRQAYNQNDVVIEHIAESSGLIHTVDCLFGIIQDPMLYLNNEYYLKTLVNRDEGYKNSKKKFKIDYDYLKITEDLNDDIIYSSF